MSGRPGGNRRRSVRNKTIVFDATTFLKEEEPALPNPGENISVVMNTKAPVSQIDYRSFHFNDLLNAFHSIEKRDEKDPTFISEALKKFKTNEELSVNIDHSSIKEIIKIEIFPKIRNNPFIRNDEDVPFRKIEKGFGRSPAMRSNKQIFDKTDH